MQTAIIAFDSKQLNLILTKMLGCFGFETIIAENTEQLRLALQKEKTALLLCDWFLDTDSTLDFLAKQTNLPKIIFVSKENNPEKIAQTLQAGVDEYIIKPFDNDILQSKLSMVGLL